MEGFAAQCTRTPALRDLISEEREFEFRFGLSHFQGEQRLILTRPLLDWFRSALHPTPQQGEERNLMKLKTKGLAKERLLECLPLAEKCNRSTGLVQARVIQKLRHLK